MLQSDTFTEDNSEAFIKGNFLVVEVEGKAREVRYIAIVDTVEGDEFKDTFLKRVPQTVGHVSVFIINKTNIVAFQPNDGIAT